MRHLKAGRKLNRNASHRLALYRNLALALFVVSTFVAHLWILAAALFVGGWVLQFVGHAYEGKKPAFLTNLTHLLIGPLWIAHLAVQRRPS